MVSFDASNLFTNVPKMETIPIVNNLLQSKNIDPVTTSHVIALLKFCLSQDFFPLMTEYTDN